MRAEDGIGPKKPTCWLPVRKPDWEALEGHVNDLPWQFVSHLLRVQANLVEKLAHGWPFVVRIDFCSPIIYRTLMGVVVVGGVFFSSNLQTELRWLRERVRDAPRKGPDRPPCTRPA